MPSFYPILFQSNEPLVANASSVLVPVPAVDFKMLRPGSIVGIAASLKFAVGLVGSITFTIAINGLPGALALTLHNGLMSGFAASAPGIDTYQPGDVIGVHTLLSSDFDGDLAVACAMISIYEPLLG